MQMNEKIEIILNRKKLRKTDLAERVGITYRALANYMNGTRKPRSSILVKIAKELDVTPEFLSNDSVDMNLTIEEEFIKNTCRNERERSAAIQFFDKSRGLFAGNSYSEDDMQLLISALGEIFKDSRKNPEE
ncbi:MAG: helix-turn-helix domain-containing protein [Oscillospiraceae bacterium]